LHLPKVRRCPYFKAIATTLDLALCSPQNRMVFEGFEYMASVEVMTACENICRDFWWITVVDPRIWQGLLTVVAAGIASVTALHIAKSVYSEQKKIDRRIQKEHERREIYRGFWEVTNRHFSVVHQASIVKDLDGINESHLELISRASGIVLYAEVEISNNVLEVCRKYYQRLLEYETYVKAECGDEASTSFLKKNPERYEGKPFEKVKLERKRVLLALRRDLGDSVEKAEQAAEAYFVYTAREEVE